HVTVAAQTIPLKHTCLVVATQNPIEYEGTYPLPEAQLDPFLSKLQMGYPSQSDELEMLKRTEKTHPIAMTEPVMTSEELILAQEEVAEKDYVAENIQQYNIN